MAKSDRNKSGKKLKKLKKRLTAMETATGVNAGAGGTAAAANAGFLGGLNRLLPSRASEQFLVGVALGAAGAWIVSDTELRGKLVKAGMRMYANVASGVEEMKEQMEDIKAELAAEQTDAA